MAGLDATTGNRRGHRGSPMVATVVLVDLWRAAEFAQHHHQDRAEHAGVVHGYERNSGFDQSPCDEGVVTIVVGNLGVFGMDVERLRRVRSRQDGECRYPVIIR
jgi:hypothetical protein